MKNFLILITLLFANFAFAAPRTLDADRFKRVTGVASGSIMTLPDIVGGAELVCTSCTQTISNKTHTSPIINTPTITGGTASGVSITGGTVSGSTNTNSTFTNPTIIGGTVSGSTNTNSTFTNPTITGGSISGTSIITSGAFLSSSSFTNGVLSGTTLMNTIINGASNTISNLDLSSQVTGVLPIARGGTNNGSLSVSAGAVAYTDGSKVVTTNTPSSGQILVASGTTPVWTNAYSVQAIPATTIDWSQASAYTKTLSANTTFTFSNAIAGQNIIVRLTNTASNYTVTWPASGTLKWSTGVAPTMTTGAKTDVYTFFYDGTLYYGSAVQNMF